jgi:membrane protease YdiL (CAAX protease family)
MPHQIDTPVSLLARAANYLHDAHLARGGAYLGLAAITMQAFTSLLPRSTYYDLERVHLAVLPITLGVTRAFAELRAEDRAHWQAVPVRSGLAKFAQGAGIGAGALLITLGIARSQGWLSAPKWGFEDTHPMHVAGSMAVSTLGHLAVAWNEELVFRGYGHRTLALALPRPLADTLLIALFALAHPLKPRTLVGEAALGLALLALRHHYDDIWMPVGYHWAWNTLQTAAFGPSDGAPSLRPLVVHGPPEWVGRPGHPEPGYLSTLASLAVAIGIFLWSRRRGRHR